MGSISASPKRGYTLCAGTIAYTIAVCVLYGWLHHVQPVKALIPGWASMKANTALCFALTGIALALHSSFRSRSLQILSFCFSATAFIFGFLNLLEYSTSADLGIDQILVYDDTFQSGMNLHGRMSFMTAFCFVVFNSALVIETAHIRKFFYLVQPLALLGTVLTLLALVGYAYGVHGLYKVSPYSSMAIHTVLCFLLVGTGLIALRPDEGIMAAFLADSLGGNTARRLLPAAILIPFLLGTAILSAERAGFFDSDFGTAAFTVMTMLCLTILIMLTAYSLHSIDMTQRSMKEELKLIARRKDEFLATLAHELRNPLAPIQNAVNVIKRTDKDTLKKEGFEVIENQLNQMIRLIDDLIDVSRITNGKIELRKEVIDLKNIISAAQESTFPLLQLRNHALKIVMEPGQVWVDGDSVRLIQVFSNLLNNAAKYTEPGGHISLSVSASENIVSVAVQDDGIGIAPEVLPAIFEMFSQVDGSMERSQGGLGIGLALTRSLVEQHGGNVRATSAGIGKGSIFTVTLPSIRPSISEEVKSEKIDSFHSQKRFKILVVDDNKPSAQTLGWMMESCGHEYRLAFDGHQAVEMAKSWLPHIVLLDIGMPGMNGFETCTALRKEQSLKDTLFVAQTGWDKAEHKARALEAGFHHHLVKPVDITSLHKILKAAEAA